jgi:hypothetical protein
VANDIVADPPISGTGSETIIGTPTAGDVVADGRHVVGHRWQPRCQCRAPGQLLALTFATSTDGHGGTPVTEQAAQSANQYTPLGRPHTWAAMSSLGGSPVSVRYSADKIHTLACWSSGASIAFGRNATLLLFKNCATTDQQRRAQQTSSRR